VALGSLPSSVTVYRTWPPPVTELDGLHASASKGDEFTHVRARTRVPLNPLIGVTVMVNVPFPLLGIVKNEGEMLRERSLVLTTNSFPGDWDSRGLFPPP
jgi:hypothetical protein